MSTMKRASLAALLLAIAVPLLAACSQQQPAQQPANQGYPQQQSPQQTAYPQQQQYPQQTTYPAATQTAAQPAATQTAAQTAFPFPLAIPSNLPAMIPTGLIPGFTSPASSR